ncbi:MAG: hypothetical protein PHN64_03300 [Desulfovibrionaceae bacterium]|nr:hypothetical protein [Desulfovibrionaceae bacterium]
MSRSIRSVAALSQSRAMPQASLEAGSYRGTLRGWQPLRTAGRGFVADERTLSLQRAEDL